MISELRLGSRPSPLALAQARMAAQALTAASGVPVRIVQVSTAGDEITDRPFEQIGPKGIFTGALQRALSEGRIDAAVHSCKDLAAATPVTAVLPRADYRDVVVGVPLERARSAGTSSLRRAAQLRRSGFTGRIVPLRGNVGTRVAKADSRECDAAVLAAAGLIRAGLADRIVQWLDDWLPAPAQGAIAIESPLEWVVTLDDPLTRKQVDAERSFMGAVEGGCSVPLGALARVDGETVTLRGFLSLPDASRWLEATAQGTDAVRVGLDLAAQLRTRGAEDILAQLKARQGSAGRA